MTIRPRSFALLPLAAIALAGCAVTTSGGPAPDPAASASRASAAASQSSVAAAQSAIASEVASESAAADAPCTSNACVATAAELALPGLVANDESVITKAVCYESTVKHHAAAGTWTVKCRTTYSDGKTLAGYANLLPDQDKITWEPAG